MTVICLRAAFSNTLDPTTIRTPPGVFVQSLIAGLFSQVSFIYYSIFFIEINQKKGVSLDTLFDSLRKLLKGKNELDYHFLIDLYSTQPSTSSTKQSVSNDQNLYHPSKRTITLIFSCKYKLTR